MLVRAVGSIVFLVALYFGVRATVDAIGLGPFLFLVGLIVAIEVGAAVSALLDWREAKLQISDRGRGWLIGHTTLVHRLTRRARWHAATLRLYVPAAVQARRLELPAQPAAGAPTAAAADDQRAA